MADDENLVDDWFIKSLKSYRHLHMFDLQQPTYVIEWIDKDGVCVAGCDPNSHNEILELSIPAKLMQEEGTAGAGLTKDRDFKMRSGGFSDHPIHCMKYLNGTLPRLIVTGSHMTGDLDVWQLGTESSDVIKKLSSLHGRGKEGGGVRVIGQRPGHTGQVAFGSTLSDVQIVDVETRNIIQTDFGRADCTVEIQFLDEDKLVLCNTLSGLINIHDLRTTSNQSVPSIQHTCDTKTEAPSEVKGRIDQSCEGLVTCAAVATNQDTPTKEGDTSWTFDLSCSSDLPNDEDISKRPKMDFTMATIARLSSNNEIIINELRNLQKPLHFVRLGDGMKRHTGAGVLTVKWSPTDRNLLSVSGVNGCVDIYDISSCQQYSPSPPIIKPIFSHEGHMFAESANQETKILCHTWYSWKPQVMMSSGNDGSLHAWNWSAVS